MGNTALNQQLASRAAAVEKKEPPKTIEQYLMQNQEIISQALPKHMNAERLTRMALTVIRTNKMLKQCTMPSLAGAIMQAAMLGLEPSSLGHCYFVPFRNNKTNEYEVQFIIGYKGMIDLAWRTGEIESIIAREVCENDHFKFELGLEESIEHSFDLRKDRGKAYAYYAVAKYKGGGHTIMVMSKSDIEKHKARSKAAKNGPWVTDYDEMAKKTVIRAMFKYLPISVEVAQHIESDGGVSRGMNFDAVGSDELIDITPEYELEDEPPTSDAVDELDPNQTFPFEQGGVEQGNGAQGSLL